MGIRSRIFLIVFLLLTVSISITYVVAERDLTNTFKLQIVDELEKQANLLLVSVDNLNKFSDISEADKAANDLGKASNSRVTFINNDGNVIGDSLLDLEQIVLLDNHGNRSEVIDALSNGIGWSSRYSQTLNQDLLYFAIKDNQGVNPNIIRVSVPLNYLDAVTDTLGLSVILLFAVVFLLYPTSKTDDPFGEITLALRRRSQTNPTLRIPEPQPPYIHSSIFKFMLCALIIYQIIGHEIQTPKT